MTRRERKTAEERKEEICKVAKKILLKKGFRNMTMEEIIREVGLSKGGVYHYYNNTKEILFDIVMRGNTNRYDNLRKFMTKNKNLSMEELAVELALQRLLREDEYNTIYAQFILELNNDPKLKELYDEIFSAGKEEFIKAAEDMEFEELKALVNEEYLAFFSSIILGIELLGNREVFERHPEFLRDIVKNYLDKNR